MVDEKYTETLATAEVLIQVVAGLADAVQSPGNPDSYRNALLEHKVAASLAKKLSKHLVPAE